MNSASASAAGIASADVAPSIDRSQLFFWLYAIAGANALIGLAIRDVDKNGWAVALFGLFGISAIVWVALAAGLDLLHQDRERVPLRKWDRPIAAVVLLLAIIPISALSGVAIALLGLYAALTGAPGSAQRRSGIIFLAISGNLIWGRLVLAMFSRSLLSVDAFLVGGLFDADLVGNRISFFDGSGSFVVAPGCSSLQGMSLALVFWATVNQWYQVPFGWRPAIWCGLALLATVAINVIRLGLLAAFPAHFDALHDGIGWHVASWGTLTAVVFLVVYGARREIFAQR